MIPRKLTAMSATPHTPRPKFNFTAQEDMVLKNLVAEFGEDNWNLIASRIPARNPRQCKDRWTNYLSPGVTMIPWTPEEDDRLIAKVQEFGRRWVRIAEFFPMRTDVHIKNRYIVLQRRETREAASGRPAPGPPRRPRQQLPSLSGFAPAAPILIAPWDLENAVKFLPMIQATTGENPRNQIPSIRAFEGKCDKVT
jgi:hypothetical protein